MICKVLQWVACSAGLFLTASLCRFTVRDVGFGDLGDAGYKYYVVVSDSKTPGLSVASRLVAAAVVNRTWLRPVAKTPTSSTRL